jgi:hypothetical protein
MPFPMLSLREPLDIGFEGAADPAGRRWNGIMTPDVEFGKGRTIRLRSGSAAVLAEHPLITPALSGTVRDQSHLPEPRLLDAAHIFTDADEQMGQPVIPNALPLTKIHQIC